jgi:hypothetical protein
MSKKKIKYYENKRILYLLASISGIISMVLQHFFISDLKQYDSPLFPLIRTGIEGHSEFWPITFKRFGVKLLSNLSGWKTV